MYKVLIVDDNTHFVTQLQSMIAWETLGYCVMDIEVLGIAALGKFFTYEPDILILSSSVYIMSGEEFLQSIQSATHNFRVLYLYDTPIDNDIVTYPQVSAYIAHDSVTPHILKNALKTAAHQLQNESEVALSLFTTLGSNNDLEQLKQTALTQLFNGLSTHQFENIRRMTGLRLQSTDLILAMYHIPQSETLFLHQKANLEHLFQSYSTGEQITLQSQWHCILFNLPNIGMMQQNKVFEEMINKVSNIIQNKNDDHIQLYASFSMHISELHREFIALQELPALRYFTDKSVLVRSHSQNIIALEQLQPQIDQLCGTIRDCLAEQHEEQLCKALETLFFDILKRSMNYLVRTYIRQCLTSIQEIIFQCKNPEVQNCTIPESFSCLDEEHNWYQNEFLRLSSLYAKQKKQICPYVLRSVDYITEHYTEEISLLTASNAVGISRSYLCTRFKKDMGMGFSEYLNRFRVTKAKKMLQSYSVSQVAFNCGFWDPKYFSRVFKQYTGLSPKQYQSKLNSDQETENEPLEQEMII